jgi:hypothetical protein
MIEQFLQVEQNLTERNGTDWNGTDNRKNMYGME